MRTRVAVSAAWMMLAAIGAGCTSEATRNAEPAGSGGQPARPTLVRRTTPSSATPATAGGGTAAPAATPSAAPSGATSTTAAAAPPATSLAPTATTKAPTTSLAPTTTKPPTTTTTVPLVTAGAVILVANASNVDGAAGRLTDRLRGLGFTVQRATTAAGPEAELEVSKVYLKRGAEKVARSVANLLGVTSLSYMPTPISIRGGPANLGKATVVIMLGKDLADKQ